MHITTFRKIIIVILAVLSVFVFLYLVPFFLRGIHGGNEQFSYKALFRIPSTECFCLIVDTTGHSFKDVYFCKDSLLLQHNVNSSEISHFVVSKKYDDSILFTFNEDTLFYVLHPKDILECSGDMICLKGSYDDHTVYDDYDHRWYALHPYVQLAVRRYNNSTLYRREKGLPDSTYTKLPHINQEICSYRDYRESR